MVFKRDPVVPPGSQSTSFDNKVITDASYSENNGDAEFDMAANQSLLASFSNDRRTIVVSRCPAGDGAWHRWTAESGAGSTGCNHLLESLIAFWPWSILRTAATNEARP